MEYLKTQTKIRKLLKEQPEEERVTEGVMSLMTLDNVCLVKDTSKEGKTLLRPFSNIANKEINFQKGDVVKAKFNIDYLKKIIEVFKTKGTQSVTLEFNNDYPLFISDEDLSFVLAPVSPDD